MSQSDLIYVQSANNVRILALNHSHYVVGDMQHQHNATHNHGPSLGLESIFLSHATAGCFLFLLGLWSWIQSLRRRYSVTRHSHSKYTATAAYEATCCRNKLAEGLVTFVMSLFCIVVEGITVVRGRNREYAYFPFYSAMLCASLVDILLSVAVYLPEGIDYCMHIMPFLFQAYCFRAQSYDQPHVTANTRMAASYLNIMAVGAIALEMNCRHNILITWIKSGTIMVAGTWYFQMIKIMNPPFGTPWLDSHDNVMYVAIYAAWHMIIMGFVQLVVLLLTAKCIGASSDWTLTKHSANGRLGERLRMQDHVQYTKLLDEDHLENST